MMILLTRPARDGDDLPVDPSSILADQERHHTGNIDSLSAAAQRAVVRHALLDDIRRQVRVAACS